MKAALFKEKNTIEIDDIDKPVLNGKKGALIKVKGCGLCGSDIVKLKHATVPVDTVLGHEVVGIIVDKNSDNSVLNIGDRVALGHHYPCFDCVYCRSENYSMCREFKKTNIKPGGFSEYIYVTEGHLDNTVYKVPDNLSDIDASFMEPVACCLRAVKRSDIKSGDKVIVMGLGSIGILLGQVAKAFGAFVTGCDIIDERLELAKKLKFDSVLKFTTLEETSDIYHKNVTAIGADKIFLASGATSSIDSSIACIRDGGKIIVFSSIPIDAKGFTNNDIYYRELSVMGSYSPAPIDLKESLAMINDGVIKTADFSQIYSLDKINEAINDTITNKIIKAYIKL